MPDQNKLSRREFIKDAAVGVAAVAGASVLGIAPAPAQFGSQPRPPAKWDYEADVVVVGYGGAGVCAAIAAHDAGAKVLVLEKSPTAEGGNSGCSEGCTQLPEGSNRIRDWITYVKMCCWGTVTDDELISAYVHGVNDIPAWVESLGGVTNIQNDFTTAIPKSLPVGFVSPDFSGLEYPNPVFRIMLPDGKSANGTTFFSFLKKCAGGRGIPVMLGTPAKELIQDPTTKEILGVKALTGVTPRGAPTFGYTGGKEIFVKAARGVVLACGGFENNPEMRINFQSGYPHSEWTTFGGTPYNTGDGIVMAQRVGAKLWHMSRRHTTGTGFANKPASQAVGIGIAMNADNNQCVFVNRYGKRFMNERCMTSLTLRTREYSYFDQENSGAGDSKDFCDYPNIPFYMIFDDTLFQAGPLTPAAGLYPSGYNTVHNIYAWSNDNRAELAKGWILKADTIKALGQQIVCKDFFGRVVGMDAAGLVETLNKYNSYCAAGKDLDFDRPASWLKPINTPPFYAVELCEAQLTTSGGPVHNRYAQTLDLDGRPIPRLYSAGELGSIFGFLNTGAGNLGEAFAMGRIAGAHAATLKPWEST